MRTCDECEKVVDELNYRSIVQIRALLNKNNYSGTGNLVAKILLGCLLLATRRRTD